MQQELTKLLRAVPFVPFVISTRDGLEHPVGSVGRLVAGRALCAYVNQEGYISLIPYGAIDRISTRSGD
jgi:hypothetical protein